MSASSFEFPRQHIYRTREQVKEMTKQRCGEMVAIRFQLDKTGFNFCKTLQMFACILVLTAEERHYALIGIAEACTTPNEKEKNKLWLEQSS